jgi:hypothetical protein
METPPDGSGAPSLVRALFRGVLAVVVRHGARDFHRVERLTPKLLEEERMTFITCFRESF